nr:MAG: hypothetical protein TU35_08045 [Thermoproteus sp. AZ2]
MPWPKHFGWLAKQDIAVVSDDDIVSLVNRSMLVQYRVRLNREKKTVEPGGLWSEEYLPQFALLYSGVYCRGVGGLSASDVCDKFKKFVNGKSFWIGGKETIGKGLAKFVVP